MEKTYELIRKAQAGNQEAAEQLLQENSGLIWNVVKRFYGRYESEDLYQIGAIGLLKSIEKFDFSYDVRFSTYAVPVIIGEIRRFLRDDGMIKISRSLKELSYRAKKMQESVLQEENREISIGELADRLQVDREELILAMESAKEVESIYVSKGESISENGIPLIDCIADLSEKDTMIEKISLKEALNSLNDKERQIIFLRYFQDRTQMDVAGRIGISQVQVSRMEKKILGRLKDSMQ